MARRIAVTSLNDTTYNILNTIRQNASPEYQAKIPEVTEELQLRAVGDVLYGYPALANQFLSALVNRIALVRVKSALFNNAYTNLKKGYLEFGETVEEVFVGIAKAREFSAEKAEKRELKRTLPDVRTAFHAMNWRVQYPVTIQQNDLKQAFMSLNGVQDLIAKIVNSVYVGAEYDEFLLFKYLMIKGIAHGKLTPISVDTADIKDSAVAFRGTSNKITFMSNKYNSAGVTTATPKSDQYIFMDSTFNAQYDVEVLASAFNMEKADFMGRVHLIDDWTTFDNERFDEIRANSDMIEEVTAEELELMKGVKAVLVDEEWFQVYDNTIQFTEQYVASGMYWNYFLNVWKTVSTSPFSNAVVFAENGNALTTIPDTIECKVVDIIVKDNNYVTAVLNVIGDYAERVKFIQTEKLTEGGVAVKEYGLIMANSDSVSGLQVELEGVLYTSTTVINYATNLNTVITFTKQGE